MKKLIFIVLSMFLLQATVNAQLTSELKATPIGDEMVEVKNLAAETMSSYRSSTYQIDIVGPGSVLQHSTVDFKAELYNPNPTPGCSYANETYYWSVGGGLIRSTNGESSVFILFNGRGTASISVSYSDGCGGYGSGWTDVEILY